MRCDRCGKWAGAHGILPGQPTDHLCLCPGWREVSAAKQSIDAKRWRFMAEHWNSLMGGIPLHRWLDEQALRHGGLTAALDYAINYHESGERHIR